MTWPGPTRTLQAWLVGKDIEGDKCTQVTPLPRPHQRGNQPAFSQRRSVAWGTGSIFKAWESLPLPLSHRVHPGANVYHIAP